MTTHEFDKDYWDQHWRGRADVPASTTDSPPNPYIARETTDLTPGTALDAGCGSGAEAVWLASHGWRVTAADISSDALGSAARRGGEPVDWVEADLTTWEPGTRFDLVTTHYAHPAMPQLEFYDRIARWVAPGGTLLIVGHLAGHDSHGHGHGHAHPAPAEASATAAAITARLGREWQIVTADEHVRTPDGRAATLHDVVVRAALPATG